MMFSNSISNCSQNSNHHGGYPSYLVIGNLINFALVDVLAYGGLQAVRSSSTDFISN